MFAQLVLARIIEPVSKPGSLRVLEEAGAAAASYRTATRPLRVYARAVEAEAVRHYQRPTMAIWHMSTPSAGKSSALRR